MTLLVVSSDAKVQQVIQADARVTGVIGLWYGGGGNGNGNGEPALDFSIDQNSQYLGGVF